MARVSIGQRREKLELLFSTGEGEARKASGQKRQIDLDTSGKVSGSAASAFPSPKELGNIPAKNEICLDCIVKQYFHFRELITAMTLVREFPAGQQANVTDHH